MEHRATRYRGYETPSSIVLLTHHVPYYLSSDMNTFFKWSRRVIGTLFLIFLCIVWLAYFSPRPKNMTDPAVLAGDGSQVDYCALPELDGSGKRAADIPKANTPGCHYTHFPLPVLSECTEPIVDGGQDIRGLWKATSGRIGHVERIEQCGARTVVTAAGIIHDMGPNSSGGVTSNDTEGYVLFTLAGKEHCMRTSASAVWRNRKLEFNAFKWGPVVVRRYRDGDQLVWEYADGTVTRMDRICQLPPEHKTPKPRGRRFKIF